MDNPRSRTQFAIVIVILCGIILRGRHAENYIYVYFVGLKLQKQESS